MKGTFMRRRTQHPDIPQNPEPQEASRVKRWQATGRRLGEQHYKLFSAAAAAAVGVGHDIQYRYSIYGDVRARWQSEDWVLHRLVNLTGALYTLITAYAVYHTAPAIGEILGGGLAKFADLIQPQEQQENIPHLVR